MDMDGPLVWMLVFLAGCVTSMSGTPCAPEHLWLSAWDGEVTVLWDPPTDITSKARYSVQMSRLNEAWQKVSSCTLIQATMCDLNRDIHNHRDTYRVRVQTVTENGFSRWSSIKKVLLNNCLLHPPTFTLRSTSSSLTLTVDEKPLFSKIFLFGMRYTIYLEDRSKHNETTTLYLDDDQNLPGGRTHTFGALSWGREYCFRLQVVSIGGFVPSAVSPPLCAVLPEPEWYKIAVPAVVALGVLTLIAIPTAILCSFVRRPESTPVALKSPPTGWSPLVVREDNLEVVTDRGWLLCGRTQAPSRIWGTADTDRKDERRTSMDSGVSVGSGGPTKAEGGDQGGLEQEDSGCVSGGDGSQGPGSLAVERHPQAGRTRASGEGKPLDSRLCQPFCSGSSEGQDRGFHAGPTHPASEQHRRPAAPAALPSACGTDEAVEVGSPWGVFTGYRRGQLTPFGGARPGVWSGPQGAWTGPQGAAGDAQEQPGFATNYRRKTHVQMETVVSVEDAESPHCRKRVVLEDAAPLLFLPLPFLPEPGCAAAAVSISLSDVELWGE